jgi:hypothetical protein
MTESVIFLFFLRFSLFSFRRMQDRFMPLLCHHRLSPEGGEKNLHLPRHNHQSGSFIYHWHRPSPSQVITPAIRSRGGAGTYTIVFFFFLSLFFLLFFFLPHSGKTIRFYLAATGGRDSIHIFAFRLAYCLSVYTPSPQTNFLAVQLAQFQIPRILTLHLSLM